MYMTPEPLPQDFPRPDDYDARMQVARDVAGWRLGDPSWANEFVAAYMYPRTYKKALDFEMDAPDTGDVMR